MYYRRTVLFRVLDALFRHIWLFVISVLVVIILVGAYVQLRPKTFTAIYSVLVDQNGLSNPLTNDQGGQQYGEIDKVVNRLQTLAQTREFLQSALKNPDGSTVPLNRPIDFTSDDQLIELQKNFVIAAMPSGDAFTVTYTAEDPDDCDKVIEHIIDLFIERTAEEKSSKYSEEVAFVGSQVAVYKDRLNHAEAELANFKRQNAGHMPGEEESIFQNLVDLQTKVQDLQLQVAKDQDSATYLQQQLAQTPKTIVASQQFGRGALDGQLQDLQNQLTVDMAVKGMLPTHPEVQHLHTAITALQQQIQQQKASGNQDSSGIDRTDMQPNPMYTSLDGQLVNLQIDEKTLRGQMVLTQQLEQNAQRAAGAVPQGERILAELARNYNTDEQGYDTLLARLEQAQLNEQLNLRQERSAYTILQTQPPVASKKKTLVLLVAGVFFAFLIGGTLVVLSEWFDRSLREPEDVERSLGVAVLAVLPDLEPGKGGHQEIEDELRHEDDLSLTGEDESPRELAASGAGNERDNQ